MPNPVPISALVSVMRQVYQVPKRCSCGCEWTGNSFVPIRDGEPLPRSATCGECLAVEEASAKALQRRPDELVRAIDVVAPREPGE